MAGKYSNMDPKEVILLAEKGDAEAQDSLGCRYVNGDDGFSVDQKLALKWFTMAANGGSVEGMYHLGVFYEAGMGGLAQDFYKAKSWYEKAAERGHSDAQCNLGAFYGRGDGVPVDYHKSAYWLKKAADQGNEIAKDNLHELVKTGLAPKSYLEKSPFEIKNGCLYAYKGSDTKLVIPDGVTEIAESCFRNNFELRSVKAPYSLKRIAKNAFRGCVQLEMVELGDNLTIIDEYAFSECFELKTISLPKSLKKIGSFAFRNCESLNRVAVPELTKYKDDSFAYCDEIALQKSKGKISSTQSSASQSNAKSSGLTDKQQQQKDELNRQIEDLRSQAAFYSAQDLSAEDRATLAETKEGIEKLGKQIDSISTDQAKFSEYLKQKEEKERKQEEERQRRIVEAQAAGKSEDDMINMYVILCNERRLASQWEKTQKEFYDAYKNYFPAYKTRELGNLRKEVKEKIKDKETRKYYTERFMNRSVKDRYDVVTDSFFALDRYADYTLRSEDAIFKTSEWYTPEEMPEVRKLMDEQHDLDKKGADDAFDPIEKKWKNYWSAKEFLKVVVRDANSEEIREDCRLFQIRVGSGYMGTVIVEVLLATKGLLQLSTPAMNFFPYYWNTTAKDIWDTAKKNEIVDNTTIYTDDINDIVRNAIKWIGERNKESYPDYKTTLNQWNSAINRNASAFAEYIAGLYNNTDRHFTAAEIKDKLKASFATVYDLAEAKEKLYQLSKRDGLVLLAEILSEHSAIKDIYDSIPKALATDIKSVREEKQSEANEKKYAETVSFMTSENLPDLIKAEETLSELGSFKDSKVLLKQVSSKADSLRSIQYDDAISLFSEGTEESVNKAITKLEELKQYRDAQTLVIEYREYLEKEKQYQDALKLLDGDDYLNLSIAEKKLSDLVGFKDVDDLLVSCNVKLDSIMSEMYDAAQSLAAEQTEESMTEAKTILSRIKPYRDSEKKIEELHDLLAKETIYKSARAIESEDDVKPAAIKTAMERLASLGGYKDSADMAADYEQQYEVARKYNYVKARKAEKVLSAASQNEASSLYRETLDYDDSKERIGICQKNIESIKEIVGLERELFDAKQVVEQQSGRASKKELKYREQCIDTKTKELEEKKKQLASEIGAENTDVSTAGLTDKELSEIYEKADQKAKAESDVITANYKKSSKKKWVILVIVAILIAAVVYLMQSGLIGNDSTEGTTTNSGEQLTSSESNTNNSDSTVGQSNSNVLNYDLNNYYGVTSGELENRLFERYNSNTSITVLDATSEVFDDHGTLGYVIDVDPQLIVIIYTQSNSTTYSKDSNIDYICFAADITDNTTEYYAKAISEIIGSPNEEAIKEDLDRNLLESKKGSDSDPNGDDILRLDPLDVDSYWTLGCLRIERTNHDIVVLAPRELDAYEILVDAGFVNN